MRFIVVVCALVFVLGLAGSFFAGYRVGTLEGELNAQRLAAAGPAQTTAPADPEQSDAAAAQAFFTGGNDRQQAISGKIKLSKALAKRLKKPLTFTKDDALFVIATKPELGPQPLAVVRINNLEGKSLPIDYQIGPADLMIQDRGVFTGPLLLKVKLSHAGDAKTNPGDLLGYQRRKDGVGPGDTGVDLELQEIAQGDVAQRAVH